MCWALKDKVNPSRSVFNFSQNLSCLFGVGFKMGTLVGHLVPGAFFLLIGVWWTFNIWGSYFRALHSRRRFQSTISFPLRQGSRVPWESIAIIVCATAAIVGELLV